MSKKNFGTFALEDLEELETGIDEAQSTAEDAQATAEDAQATADATATELAQHEADADAHDATGADEGAAADPEATAVADADVPAAETPEVDTTTAVIEEAVVDAKEAEAPAEEVEEEVEVLDEAVDRTDDVLEAVEEVEPENEDAPSEIAATVGLANESIKRLLGTRFDESMLTKLPSNETFSMKSVRTRQMYKNLAIESLQESKDGFFKKMKDAIIKLWDWIKARLDKLVTWFRGAAKERVSILVRAKEANITNRAVIENATLAQYLSLGGTIEDSATGLKKALEDLGEVYREYCSKASVVSSLFKTGYSFDVGQFNKLAPATDGKTALLGGWTLTTSGAAARLVEGSVDEALAAIDNLEVSFTRAAPSKDRVTTLTTSDIVEVFAAADKFDREVLHSRESKEARSVKSTFIGDLETRFKSNRESNSETQRKTYRLISRASSLALSPLGKLTSISNQAISTINLLAKVSIKAAKGESVEEDLKDGDIAGRDEADAATKARPGKPNNKSLADRKAGAEDVSFREVSKEDHADPTVEGGEDPLDLNPSDQPGDATLNQSSQPAAEEPGTQDAKMKESELDLPEEPQVTAALEQYDEFTDHIEDGVEGLDLTERTIAVAEGAQGKQGLDEAGAELMSIASEAIHRKWLGMESVDLGLGLESFSRSAYKLKATGISVESWKEKAQEIGKKIIEMVKKLGRMIRYVWKQFVTMFKGLEGKHERISRRLATTNEATMKNGKGFETDKFVISGKAMTPSVFASAIGSAAKIAIDVVEDALYLVEIAEDQVQGKAADAARKVQQFAIGSMLANNSDVKTSKEDDKSVYTFAELPGGRVAKFVRPAMTDGIELGFSANLGKGEGDAKKVNVRNLDKSESKQILQAVRKGLDAVKQVSSDIEVVAKQVDEIAKGLDPKKLEGQGEAAKARKAVGALGKAVMSDSKVAIQGIRLLSETGLDYVAKSIGIKGTEAQAADQATAGA